MQIQPRRLPFSLGSARVAALSAVSVFGFGALWAASAPRGWVEQHKLAPSYQAGTTLAVAFESEVQMDLIERSVEANGERMDAPAGSDRSAERWSAAWADRLSEAEGGAPVALRRTFGELSGQRQRSAMGREIETPMESPFAEAVVVLRRGDDGVEAEVEKGGAIDPERLAALALAGPLDGILPSSELELEGTYEIAGVAVERALGLHLAPNLFPPPARPAREGGEGRRGGRGGARGSAQSGTQVLLGLDWELEGRLAEVADGVARVVLQGEASGSRTEETPGGQTSSEVSATLKGELRFDLKLRQAVAFEAEVSFRMDSQSEFSRGEMSGSMSSSYGGELRIQAAVEAKVDGVEAAEQGE